MAFLPFSLSIKGRLINIDRPQVMGIVNVTPDSFYSGSRTMDRECIRKRVSEMLQHGADMLDIGAYSSRPGAGDVSPDEELRRLEVGLEAIREVSDEIIVSVDTFRPEASQSHRFSRSRHNQ